MFSRRVEAPRFSRFAKGRRAYLQPAAFSGERTEGRDVHESGSAARFSAEGILYGGAILRAPIVSALVLLCGATSADCGDDGGPSGNNNGNQSQGACGDVVLDPGEACDDGPYNSDTEPDACRTSCRLPYCGDGVRDLGEACDDGDDGSNRPDQCPNTCLAPTCGDGHVWVSHEVCDDGNTEDGDDCRSDCGQKMSDCGNGVVDAGEACDGAALGGATCVSLGLGAGTLLCGSDCQFDTGGCGTVLQCGNGTREVENGEACDGLELGGQTCVTLGYVGGALACDAQCQLDDSSCQSQCGNGLVEPNETCDDADVPPQDGDGCSALCTQETGWVCGGSPSVCTPVCGDGVVVGNEPCDASGADRVDCDADCTLPECGDGHVNLAAGEACDATGVDAPTCDADCTLPECGDGHVTGFARVQRTPVP